MDEELYVTASGFYLINYTMLYNVIIIFFSILLMKHSYKLFRIFQIGASVFSHIMVLMQFQQWENNTFKNETIELEIE